MRRVHIIIILLLLIGSTSCENQDKKSANAMLTKSEEYISQELYTEAIALLDSIHQQYPKAVKERQMALELSKTARLYQSRRDSAFTAPLLEQALSMADSMYRAFKLVEAPGMPDENIIRYKGYDPSSNPSAPFLDIYINNDGALEVVAGYAANHPTRTNSVTLREMNGQSYICSDTLPYDGGMNYRYEDLGRYFERLTFADTNAERIARFVTAFSTQANIRVEWGVESGKKGPSTLLSTPAKVAIAETYRYYEMLQQIVAMQQRLEKHNERRNNYEQNIPSR